MAAPPKKQQVKPIGKKEAKAILDEMKEKLLREISGKLREETGEGKNIGDVYDLASHERDRELSLILGDRERNKLTQIEEAYERLNDGEYGICDGCGEAIAPERMRAIPFAKLCVECKSQEEREESQLRERQILTDRTYRALSDADFDDNDN